ncbi:hypothetical protein ACQP2X_26690 [Actinoplanes sp. CA-131856]
MLQQVFLTPAAGVLEVQIDIVPGALVAGAFARSLDEDGDRALSPREMAGLTGALRAASVVRLDERTEKLTITSVDHPAYDLLEAGGGTITVRATAPLPAESRQVVFHNDYRPGQPSVVQMSVTTKRDAPLTPGEISHDDLGRGITVALTPSAPSAAPVVTTPPASVTLQERAFGALRDPLTSPWALLVLIGVCALLGAFHALTPGHGKAMLAAYLVGSRGTAGQAVLLGLVVTVTHTASVLILGAAALIAGRHVLPGVLMPSLEVAAGVIVLILGLRVTRDRWRQRGFAGRHHHHDHRPGRGSLAAMGASGGLLPCPEALGILILAVGLNRTALGLGMILAFSAGLAAVLVGLGLALVLGARAGLAGRAFAKLGRPSLFGRLPLMSAAVVVALGVVMTATGVMSFTEAGALAFPGR